jgi:hypothetical protein
LQGFERCSDWRMRDRKGCGRRQWLMKRFYALTWKSVTTAVEYQLRAGSRVWDFPRRLANRYTERTDDCSHHWVRSDEGLPRPCALRTGNFRLD